jgi:hypothetical protein
MVKVLTEDEARRIVSNIAKPEILVPPVVIIRSAMSPWR